MRELIQKLKRWYWRRFHGFVAAPTPNGTPWQQHHREEIGFTCRCDRVHAFTAHHLVVRARAHQPECPAQLPEENRCACPVTDARYILICLNCRLGHWKDASKPLGESKP